MLTRGAALLLLAVALLRGSSYLPTQFAREAFSPAFIVAAEVLLTVLVAWSFAAWRGQTRVALRMVAERPLQSLGLAVALTGAPLAFVALAIADVSTGMAAILVAPAPIFGLVFGRHAGMMHIVCYLRDGDRVFETYWTTRRGVEAMDYSYALMDLTVYGRQEPWEDSPPGWPQQWQVDGSNTRIDGRPIPQWSRLAAGRSDDLTTIANSPVPQGE